MSWSTKLVVHTAACAAVYGWMALAVGACVDGSPPIEDSNGGSGTGGSSTSLSVGDVTGMPPEPMTTSPVPTTTTPPPSSSSGTPGDSSTGGPGCGPDCPAELLDVVFVVDNTAGMAPAQARIAGAAEAFFAEIDQLEAQHGVLIDLHVMVTTTDFGNPLCTPFQPAGYSPARGAPISTACIERLDDFESLSGTVSVPEVCTEICPSAIAPSDPFVVRLGDEDNVADGTALEALQCLLPQGINGCGYESPLENMLQALNPGARWNTGPNPFLRNDASWAIVLLTNELDCSVNDYGLMEDPAFWNTHPDTGAPQSSSALCWNAGVTCDGPEGGFYSDCSVDTPNGLQPTERYTSYLVDALAVGEGKNVMMLALAGVPRVLSYSERPPHVPTSGGIADLLIRDWIDSPFPAGDIVSEEWDVGIRAADKTFEFGIGPGCSDFLGEDGVIQALPPLRIQQVCEALDDGSTNCCMDSICADDYSGAMGCLGGMLGQSL